MTNSLNLITLVLLILLQLADFYTTRRILEIKDDPATAAIEQGREENPLLARLFALIGHRVALTAAKLAVIAAMTYASLTDPMAWQITAGLCIVYALVVHNNWGQMR